MFALGQNQILFTIKQYFNVRLDYESTRIPMTLFVNVDDWYSHISKSHHPGWQNRPTQVNISL